MFIPTTLSFGCANSLTGIDIESEIVMLSSISGQFCFAHFVPMLLSKVWIHLFFSSLWVKYQCWLCFSCLEVATGLGKGKLCFENQPEEGWAVSGYAALVMPLLLWPLYMWGPYNPNELGDSWHDDILIYLLGYTLLNKNLLKILLVVNTLTIQGSLTKLLTISQKYLQEPVFNHQ